MRQATERELIEQARGGCPEACAQLIRANHAAVYGVLMHLTRDPELAEDLTQETFVTAWAKIGDFRGRASFGTWLHRIAYGKFVDARRDAGRRRARAERLADQWTEPPRPGPLAELMADERSRCVYQAVQKLDEADRTVVVLHYFQELSYREMACVLGEPVGTVKWRTSQALQALRASLNGKV